MERGRLAILYALAAVLLWSTVATAFKITLQYMPPLTMVAFASLASAAVLFGVLVWQRKLPQALPLLRKHPAYFFMLGAINPAVYYLILFQAYNLLPASQAQPLNYTWAIALTILAAVVLKQKIRKRDWSACILGYAGVVIIATQGSFSQLGELNYLGIGLALISTFLWAGYWILNTKHAGDPVVTLFWCFTLMLPILLPLAWYFHDGSHIPWQGWVAVSYVGVFEMGITFVLWLQAMRLSTNASTVSNLIFVSPFISLVLLATFLDEEITFATVSGLLLIVVGLLIQQWRRKESSPPPAAAHNADLV
ncbi:MAG: DMT superfamily drug/metabolite transporter [Idiomarinaceae bacterium HL-53]|nr:MAG: DMT superfamily drug/metabolite transporter [Idiomarinaceae bacterium HL-53]CUS47854.1 Permease of the drug/metabolite transporter (DMT) superfamily [Idiomarinaceae bacterium HL-53]